MIQAYVVKDLIDVVKGMEVKDFFPDLLLLDPSLNHLLRYMPGLLYR